MLSCILTRSSHTAGNPSLATPHVFYCLCRLSLYGPCMMLCGVSHAQRLVAYCELVSSLLPILTLCWCHACIQVLCGAIIQRNLQIKSVSLRSRRSTRRMTLYSPLHGIYGPCHAIWALVRPCHGFLLKNSSRNSPIFAAMTVNLRERRATDC